MEDIGVRQDGDQPRAGRSSASGQMAEPARTVCANTTGAVRTEKPPAAFRLPGVPT